MTDQKLAPIRETRTAANALRLALQNEAADLPLPAAQGGGPQDVPTWAGAAQHLLPPLDTVLHRREQLETPWGAGR